jgi:hypothetical protein
MQDVLFQQAVVILQAADAHTISNDRAVLASVCVMIAIKLEDNTCRSMNSLFRHLETMFSMDEVFDVERQVLRKLDYCIPPTALEFLKVARPNLSIVRGRGAQTRQRLTDAAIRGVLPSKAVCDELLCVGEGL